MFLRSRPALPVLLALLVAAPLAARETTPEGNGQEGNGNLSEKDRIEALPEVHRKWLVEEVPYLITDREKRVFLTLTSERQRQAFVDKFWRQRDLNPSTPENEFRDEHYERLDYVNNWFGRDTFRKGWQTDRGRYFILLGKPRSIQNYEARDEIYPTELWFYNNSELKRFGLPAFFYLLFWRRHGVGELQLYDPISDGPPALLTGYQPERRDFRDEVERAYEILYEFDPEVANAAMSFRTDEQDITRFQAVPFGSLSLLQDIHEVPFRGLDDSYADRLDFERGAIEADYLFTYVPGHTAMAVLPGPEDASFLHWVVQVDAQYTAFVRNEDRATFDTSFIGTVDIVLRDDPEQVVTEFRQESFVSLNDEQSRGTLQRPFAWAGVTPLIPGEHTVRIVLRNRACGSRSEEDCTKSYTLAEAEVSAPPKDGAPRLSDLVLGRRIESARPRYRPFRLGSAGVAPNPQAVYAIGENFVAAVAPDSAPEGSVVRFRIVSREPLTDGEVAYESEAPAVADAASGFVALDFSLLDIGAGRYQLAAELLDRAGGVLSSKRAEFTVSPPRQPGRGRFPRRDASVRPRESGLHQPGDRRAVDGSRPAGGGPAGARVGLGAGAAPRSGAGTARQHRNGSRPGGAGGGTARTGVCGGPGPLRPAPRPRRGVLPPGPLRRGGGPARPGRPARSAGRPQPEPPRPRSPPGLGLSRRPRSVPALARPRRRPARSRTGAHPRGRSRTRPPLPTRGRRETMK